MKRTRRIAALTLLAATAACSRCPPPDPSAEERLSADERRRRYEDAVAAPADERKFEAYLRSLPTLDGAFVTEGDLLATREEVRATLVAAGAARERPTAPVGPTPEPLQPSGFTPVRAPVAPPAPGARAAAARPHVARPPRAEPEAGIRFAPRLLSRRIDLAEAFRARGLQLPPDGAGTDAGGKRTMRLVVEVSGGAIVYWGNSEQRTFVARIDAKSFEDSGRSPTELAEALKRAGAGWQALCPGCRLQFETEGSGDPHAVTYAVRYWPKDVNGALAIAFLPRAAAAKRVLWILPPFYRAGGDSPGEERVKVLKHELGHVLGYLHEQVGTASVCAERGPAEWMRVVDRPDPGSVMYYFCGAGDRRVNDFSPLDCIQHNLVYGPEGASPACPPAP